MPESNFVGIAKTIVYCVYYFVFYFLFVLYLKRFIHEAIQLTCHMLIHLPPGLRAPAGVKTAEQTVC